MDTRKRSSSTTMIRELICKAFDHKPGFIRANYKQEQLKPPEDRVYDIKLGCVRCGTLLDSDDYDSEELKRRTAKNHEQFEK